MEAALLPRHIGCGSPSHFMCIFPGGAGGHNENYFKYASRKVLICPACVRGTAHSPCAAESPTIFPCCGYQDF